VTGSPTASRIPQLALTRQLLLFGLDAVPHPLPRARQELGELRGAFPDARAAVVQPLAHIGRSRFHARPLTNGETFWIGSGSHRLNVRLTDGAERARDVGVRVRPGQRVDLSGTLHGGDNERYVQADQVRIR
jgi:hypothetical protein